ncbi:MAG: hypothetical protein H0S79_19280 [Anaerolineaceae bacterium]|nr:hypothetical protein [Anaerolineaceae bacterium]
MDAFIDKLAYIAWAILIGIGVISLILLALKDLKYQLKISKIKFKLDAWLDQVLDLSNADKNDSIDDNLDLAISKLENGNLDSKLKNNNEFIYLTERIMFNLIHNRLRPVQNENYARGEEKAIFAVKKFYFYITRVKHFHKMEPKIFLATKIKKGFDIK